MDSAEIRNLIEQEKDPELRKTLLAEFAAFEKQKNQKSTEHYDIWEAEAQALIEEKIHDPKVKAAIWQHHGRLADNAEEYSQEADELPTSVASTVNSAKKVKLHYKILLSILAVLALMFVANFLGSDLN